jgi:hypothetical protein
MDVDVVGTHRGIIVHEPFPVATAIERNEQAELCILLKQ